MALELMICDSGRFSECKTHMTVCGMYPHHTEAVLGAVTDERSKGPKQFKQLACMAEVSPVMLVAPACMNSNNVSLTEPALQHVPWSGTLAELTSFIPRMPMKKRTHHGKRWL